MDLHDHLSLQTLCFQPPMDTYHRHFNDIRSRSLYRGIDSVSFREGTYCRILGVNIRKIAFAAEKRLRIPALTREFFLRLDITDDTRESGKIVVYKLFRLSAGAIQLLRQTKSRDAIDDTKISCFGFAPLVLGDLLYRQTVDAWISCPLRKAANI